jgi:hypothetical protein
MDITNDVKGIAEIEDAIWGNVLNILNYFDRSRMGFEADPRNFWMGVL